MYNSKFKNNLSIIIPFYNQQAITKQCIDDLCYLNDKHEIVLVDNGSIDKVSSFIREYIEFINKGSIGAGANFKYIRCDENLGFAKGCNIGYVASKSGNVLFLNNDIRVGNQSLSNWTDIIFNSKEGFLYSQNGGLIDKNFNFVRETKHPDDKFNYLSGWCLWGKRALFDKLAQDNNQEGPFKEFTLAYFEDTYMGLQARALNIPMKVMPNINVHHLGKTTSRAMNLGELYLKSRQLFINLCKDKNYIP